MQRATTIELNQLWLFQDARRLSAPCQRITDIWSFYHYLLVSLAFYSRTYSASTIIRFVLTMLIRQISGMHRLENVYLHIYRCENLFSKSTNAKNFVLLLCL